MIRRNLPIHAFASHPNDASAKISWLFPGDFRAFFAMESIFRRGCTDIGKAQQDARENFLGWIFQSVNYPAFQNDHFKNETNDSTGRLHQLANGPCFHSSWPNEI
jgi:hypothetical protein